MNLNEFNSLIDLYFYQAKKQNSQSTFLEWLNPKNKKKFTWEETSLNIYKLAKTLKENIKSGDRCLSVSENRPEWLISETKRHLSPLLIFSFNVLANL
jgi:long-chain acyl-CoA synthetase